MKPTKAVYWHRDLPPVDAEAMDGHTIEAESRRVPRSWSHRDELWDDCHADLMTHTTRRLEQEIARLGGHCAHVLSEAIEPRHDEVSGASWLHGRFEYVLYRLPQSHR